MTVQRPTFLTKTPHTRNKKGYANNIALPRLPSRFALEEVGDLEPYQSAVTLDPVGEGEGEARGIEGGGNGDGDGDKGGDSAQEEEMLVANGTDGTKREQGKRNFLPIQKKKI